MRLNELFQTLIGLFFLASLECGRSDHVHLKIHVPDLVHKHKHVKTKYVHVYHPKVVHSDHHSSIQFLHSRHDPNIGLINGGYPQPLLNLQPSKEYHINEEDFFKWRREQQRRAHEKRRQLQQRQQQQNKRHQNDEDDYEENGTVEEDEEEQQPPNYDEELYKKHKANKASSYRKESKHKNHNYSDRDYESSNSDKVYSRGNKQKRKPPQRSNLEEELAKKYRVYGVSNVDAESSNIQSEYLAMDPTAIDPGYYSTLPKNPLNVPPTNQDDIYSGLLAKKFNKDTAEKSKLLADINYNRKQQTKNLNQRKGQE